MCRVLFAYAYLSGGANYACKQVEAAGPGHPDIHTGSRVPARTLGNPTLQCASKYAAVFKCISVSPGIRGVSNGS